MWRIYFVLTNSERLAKHFCFLALGRVVESQDFGHNARLWGVKITHYTPKSSAKKYRDITFHIVIHTVV